jgi:hypothetical protein
MTEKVFPFAKLTVPASFVAGATEVGVVASKVPLR